MLSFEGFTQQLHICDYFDESAFNVNFVSLLKDNNLFSYKDTEHLWFDVIL